MMTFLVLSTIGFWTLVGLALLVVLACWIVSLEQEAWINRTAKRIEALREHEP